MREDQELIVINPRWLCSDIIGRLLSYDCLIQGPVGGRFSLDHLRSLFPKIDPGDVALTLDALELCSIVQRNNYTVYNLLLFDRSSAPQQLPTFADKVCIFHCSQWPFIGLSAIRLPFVRGAPNDRAIDLRCQASACVTLWSFSKSGVDLMLKTVKTVASPLADRLPGKQLSMKNLFCLMRQ